MYPKQMGSFKERQLLAYRYVHLALGLALWAGILLSGMEGAFILPGGTPAVSELGAAPVAWAVLAVLLACSWAAVLVKFRLGFGYFISFDISFATAAFFVFSPGVAALLSVITACIDIVSRARRREAPVGKLMSTLASNAGNRLLRFGLAFIAYRLAGGALPVDMGARDVLPAVLGFAAYFFANNLFYLPGDYLAGEDLKAFWKDAFTVDLVHSFAICCLGVFLSMVLLKLGFGPFALMAGFILSASWLLSRLTSTQEQLNSRVEDLTILSKVSAAANSALEVMPMVESFTRALAESLPADGIGVVFYQRYATTIYLVQVEGQKSRSTYLPEEKRFQYDQLPLSEPSEQLGRRLFEFLMPLETAPFFIPSSVFGLPLLLGGEPFGGIVVYNYKEGVPLNRRQWLLDTSAQTLVVALENCFLHLQAIQDPLTGLFNRSYFLYRLEEELAYSNRHQAPFALLMLDLDDFKAVNDRLGHSVGDKVIQKIGGLVRAATRREDVPARYGGDEFIVLLLGCPQSDAEDKAESVRSLIAAKALPREEAFGLTVGCSVGLLHSDDLKGDQDVPNILRRLDDALYQAKAKGKNKVVRAKA
jgi:diguanylate cyclase (GGDEF)-like protein